MYKSQAEKEVGAFSVYSGLGGVKMDRKTVSNGYFVTYVSTSWRKEVSEQFMGGNEGMIIHIDKDYKSANVLVRCCDVSWISKFPDECEILFARPLPGSASTTNFNCIMDESDGIQIVTLKL